MDLGPGLVPQNERSAFSRQINYYVDSVLGSDSNDGSHNNPLATFQRAIDLADDSNNPGENNIYLKPGFYDPVIINDEDALKVFGQGHNPWDTRVVGDNVFGDAMTILGGSDVRLNNLMFSGARDSGVFAQNLDYLFVKNVMSYNNDDFGLIVVNTNQAKVYHSSFRNNGEESNGGGGAFVQNVDHFRTMHSHYDYNYGYGISLNNVDRAQLVHSTARDNMYAVDAESRTLAEGAGVSSENIGELLVNGGQYSENAEDGIFAANVGSAAFHGVVAQYNGNDGIAVESFDSAVVDGGHFVWNGDDGVELQGFQDVANARTETMSYDVQVFGGVFHNNNEDGLDIETVYSARVIGIDSRWNDEHGLNVIDVEHLHMIGSYLYQNRDSGARFFNVDYAQLNDVVSKDNNDWGVYMQGGDRLNVIGGVFMYNGEYGILADGFGDVTLQGEGFEGLQRVDIKHAIVLHNYGGVEVNNAYLAKIEGGTYSFNDRDGIQMNNVLRGMFYHILVQDNGDDGLRYNAGFVDFANAESRDGHQDGYDWFEVDFKGGFYFNNEYNGINITTFNNNVARFDNHQFTS
ncbi:MAG: right-handed parallel beta-helix repeat-containing protein, partial [Pirellulaceae bacterium]